MRPEVVNRPGNGAKPHARRAQPRLTRRDDMPETGTIKWYDQDRRYGFIADDRGGDVFLHKSVAMQYGIREIELQKGTPVKFVLSDPQPGLRPEATAVALG